MSRSTFSGPVLVGDNRLGSLRNVGYTELVQGVSMVMNTTTPGTAGYGGSSGVFVSNVNIPNTSAVVYTQGTSTYAPQTITPDAGGTIYRGCVFYVPVGADLHDVLIDYQALLTTTSGTVSSVTAYVSNKFETGSGVYFETGGLTAVGRATLSTFTTSQMNSQQATTRDIIQGGTAPDISQVVVTLKIAGTTMATPFTAGAFNITLRYATPDNNIGNLTTYPFGNLT